MQIFILGYMYSGKSTTGRKLAKALSYDFVDTDDLFEGKYHISIPDFFTKYGEDVFRKFEKDILISTNSFQNTVISTGGGTPCSDENIQYVKNHGISIFLKMYPDTIIARLSSSRKKRPLLNNIPVEELHQFIQKQIEERNHFYQQADIIFSGKNINIEYLKKNIEEYASIKGLYDEAENRFCRKR